MSILQPVATWSIQDSTKLKCFMTCPRKYFYTYVLGWVSEEPNLHFTFGEAWHLSMSHLIEHGSSAATVSEAYELFRNKYLEVFREEDEEQNSPKNLTNGFTAMLEYAQRYDDSKYKVVKDQDGQAWTEIAGTVPISEGQVLHFKSDAVMFDEEEGKYFVLEHKTTTMLNSAWSEQWHLSIQVGTYLHALCCVFNPEDVWGARINGAVFRKPPKMKADGTPYAGGGKGNEFLRVPIRKTQEMMEQWLFTANHWAASVRGEFAELETCLEDDPVMSAFPMNTESCVHYGSVCQFHDFCINWPNPLRKCGQPPLGFKEQHWNPTVKEGEVKKIFRL